MNTLKYYKHNYILNEICTLFSERMHRSQIRIVLFCDSQHVPIIHSCPPHADSNANGGSNDRM